MSAYIRRTQNNVTGVEAKPWIPVNRWTENGSFSIMTTIVAPVTYTIETTIDPVNRPDEIALADVVVCSVENAIGLTADARLNITNTPLEAIRINQTAGAGSVRFKVMQNGSGR